jgi:hypothetical protein
MGLDMYASTTSEDIAAVDFSEPKDADGIFYWRKHPDLHGWMENLYREKGGTEEDFNLVGVRLDSSDLDLLENVVKADMLPHTAGFFFGASKPEDKDRTLEFVRLARAALASGKRVFYHAWW